MPGEELPVEREEDNQHDEHAVAVMKNWDIVGHVPRFISKSALFFIKCGGEVHTVNNLALIRDPAFIAELSRHTPSL